MIESLCLSAAILIAIGLAYTLPRFWVVIPVICAVIFLMGGRSPAVFTSTALVLVVTWGCGCARVRTARFWMAATAAACAPYVVIAPSIFANYREVQQLREEYPVQSLADRLAYEQPLRSSSRRSVDPERKESAVEKRMSQEYQPWDRGQRREALEMLFDVHIGFASDFTNTQGQGDDRTPRRLPPHRAQVELPEPEPIPVVPEMDQDSTPNPDSTGDAQPADIEIAANADDQLSGFHADGVVDFANPESFGAIDLRSDMRWKPDLHRVIGFQAHAFRHRPRFPQRRGATWKIEQLQLVSLLKHETPVAYLSENLPRMEELREARTRPLNEFEESALKQLRSGEELVVHETRDTIEMLGALRAIYACTECHQVPRQTLLGAFSYRLRRPEAQTPKSAL
jgi:hypothetical protein